MFHPKPNYAIRLSIRRKLNRSAETLAAMRESLNLPPVMGPIQSRAILVGAIGELVPLVCGGCLATWAFDSRSACWEIGLLVEPTKSTAQSGATNLHDLAMRELLHAFGTAENPLGHVVLFLEEMIDKRQADYRGVARFRGIQRRM
jgi:hypothetical protein